MLKEAIAEAKAVKEMAIANAKAALEEAFTPQLKSMLSLKLQEMELEEDEYLNEYSEEHEDPETKGRIMTKDVTEEVDLEELLAELELEEDEVEKNLYEAEEGEEDEEEDEATEDVDLSDEEIKDMIEDVLAQMIKDGEIEAGPNFEAEEGEEDEEEVNLEELLKEIEEMEKYEYSTNEIFNPSAPAVEMAMLGFSFGLMALGAAYHFSKGAIKKEELKKRITNLILSKQKGTLDKEWETMKKDMENDPQLKQKVLDNLDLIQKMGLSLDEAETGNPMLDALKSVAADQNVSLSDVVKGSEKVEDTVEKIDKGGSTEIEEMEKEMKTESLETGLPSEAEVKAAADKIAAAVKSGEISQEDFQAFLQAGREEAKDDIATLNEAEGEPSKEEIQNMLKDDIKDLRREKSVWKIATALGITLASAGLVTLGLGFILDAAAVNAAKAFQVVGMAPQVLIGLGGLASGAAAGIASANKVYQANLGIASKEYQLKKMDKELTEAYSTIKSLRSELNEINLLNAKLLYTNKIFKAKNLNENQKVKVLSSFDKAKNVGEVKMVYETLNEGIKVAKTTIKENLGRASKSTVTPTTKQPIVESNDVFKRMQKLAGLI
jgi:hypothetical protein